MNALRASRVGLAIALALASVAPVSAQEAAPPSGPVRLTPRPPAPNQAAPNQAAPAAPAPAEAPAEAGSARREALPIETQELRAPNVEAVGLLDAASGSLGAAMWAGSSRATIARLLADLPAATPSATARALTKRLLLTPADVPGDPNGPSLLSARVERLMAMGEVESAVALLALAPARLANETTLKAKVEGLLLVFNEAAACKEIEHAPRESKDPFWLKAQILCRLLGGDKGKAQAQLGLDLLREQKGEDAAFVNLAEGMLGLNPPPLASLADPQPLHIALLRAAKKTPPADIVRARHPGVLRALALGPVLDLDTRLAAAERALALGVIEAEDVRRLYNGLQFTDRELAQALTAADGDRGPRARALVFRATRMQTQPVARAELVAKAMAQAVAGNAFLTAARLYEPLIREMPPGPGLVWFAPVAARALLGAGDAAAALPWIELAMAARAPEDRPMQVLLAPLARLALPSQTGANGVAALLEAWMGQQKDVARDLLFLRAGTLFGLLDALGDPPGEAWLALNEGSRLVALPLPRPALWHGLRLAESGKRLGETVLYALASLGEAGPASDPVTLYRAVAALKALGLEREARQIAIEAALASGV